VKRRRRMEKKFEKNIYCDCDSINSQGEGEEHVIEAN
jgi:hypothetical protein